MAVGDVTNLDQNGYPSSSNDKKKIVVKATDDKKIAQPVRDPKTGRLPKEYTDAIIKRGYISPSEKKILRDGDLMYSPEGRLLDNNYVRGMRKKGGTWENSQQRGPSPKVRQLMKQYEKDSYYTLQDKAAKVQANPQSSIDEKDAAWTARDKAGARENEAARKSPMKEIKPEDLKPGLFKPAKTTPGQRNPSPFGMKLFSSQFDINTFSKKK